MSRGPALAIPSAATHRGRGGNRLIAPRAGLPELLDYTRLRWEDGERRLRNVPPASRRQVERVVDQTVAELRRRLGSAFTAAELAELYEASSAWTMALAVRVAPREPLAWEHWVADAAFARYLRGATDWQSKS